MMRRGSEPKEKPNFLRKLSKFPKYFKVKVTQIRIDNSKHPWSSCSVMVEVVKPLVIRLYINSLGRKLGFIKKNGSSIQDIWDI
jgi:hypothetical protein